MFSLEAAFKAASSTGSVDPLLALPRALSSWGDSDSEVVDGGCKPWLGDSPVTEVGEDGGTEVGDGGGSDSGVSVAAPLVDAAGREMPRALAPSEIPNWATSALFLMMVYSRSSSNYVKPSHSVIFFCCSLVLCLPSHC